MKIAVVTGASSGMGREFAVQIESLYKELDEIWVIARREERLRELESRMMTKIRIFTGDLLQNEIYQKLGKELQEVYPDIRMLVNAAGFGKTGMAEEIPLQDQLDMVDLNCRSLTHMTILCIPYMTQGSRIVNLASAAAFCPQPSFTVYAATKSYVLSFSRGLNAELEEKGIHVTAVCPGPVDTEFFDGLGEKTSVIKKAAMVKPEHVVKQALLDAKDKKEMSVYGKAMKMCKASTKVLPHGLIIKGLKHI